MYTVQTKSMMAKLMATENIKVEHHGSARTASFDLKNRVLRCPIWKDMSGDLYDLLMGHEISHALRTPKDGWHDAVTYLGENKKASPKEQKAFKNFLNVVEDARIEKLVKTQYPGLRAPMVRGYKDLVARDFFGLSTISDYNDLYLIDKLNLHTKVGALLNIRFSAKERPFVIAIEKIETWEETVDLARKLYAYSKKEQEEGEEKKKGLRQQFEDEQDKSNEEAGEPSEDEEYGDGSEEGEYGDGSEEGEESEEEGEDASDDEEEKADDRTTQKSKGKGEEGKKSDDTTDQNAQDKQSGTLHQEFTPEARTDENFRQKEESLVAPSGLESIYVKIPTPNLKDIVVPTSRVNQGITGHYQPAGAGAMLQAFKLKNDDYVMLLAKEFEMRKAARSYKSARISDTGDIDVNKLANYRLEDNIFKRLMIVNKGKSHGLVLLLDRSHSMAQHIEAATEQILIMALFCRKVNIPFAAYTFTNDHESITTHDFPGRDPQTLKQFSSGPNEIIMGGLSFREILNSNMQAAEFNQAMVNQLSIAKSLGGSRHDVTRSAPPAHEGMGSTPLNEALVVLRDILRQFKMMHRLDMVNAIIVHDGDSDGNSQAHGSTGAGSYPKVHFNIESHRVTIEDSKESLSFLCPQTESHAGLTTALLNWIQTTTGCGVFGFYIAGSTPKELVYPFRKMYYNKFGIGLGDTSKGRHDRAKAYSEEMMKCAALGKELFEQKFLESFTPGYTRFYFLPGGKELRAGNDEMESNGKSWTAGRLLSAFKKVNKKKSVSRVLVGRFIQLIAAH